MGWLFEQCIGHCYPNERSIFANQRGWQCPGFRLWKREWLAGGRAQAEGSCDKIIWNHRHWVPSYEDFRWKFEIGIESSWVERLCYSRALPATSIGYRRSERQQYCRCSQRPHSIGGFTW